MSPDEIKHMTRDELIHYRTSRGFRCYDHESTVDLRVAALENYKESLTHTEPKYYSLLHASEALQVIADGLMEASKFCKAAAVAHELLRTKEANSLTDRAQFYLDDARNHLEDIPTTLPEDN